MFKKTLWLVAMAGLVALASPFSAMAKSAPKSHAVRVAHVRHSTPVKKSSIHIKRPVSAAKRAVHRTRARSKRIAPANQRGNQDTLAQSAPDLISLFTTNSPANSRLRSAKPSAKIISGGKLKHSRAPKQHKTKQKRSKKRTPRSTAPDLSSSSRVDPAPAAVQDSAQQVSSAQEPDANIADADGNGDDQANEALSNAGVTLSFLLNLLSRMF